jgi:catechol 2,3-dioxygenase-like lactoylglutathione lyase family enzyme
MLDKFNIVAFVPVKDAARAQTFYAETLGLRFVKDDGYALLFDANGIMVRMAKVPGEFKPAHFTILGWEVSDIEKTVTSLQEKGVKFERIVYFKQDELGIWTAPSGDKVAWFKDPDGNTLSVSQHV